MVEQLNGTWALESSENWEEYMKEVGVGLIQRKAAAAITPTAIISNNGNEWRFQLKTTLKNTDLTATENQEFTESIINFDKKSSNNEVF
jgi:hypothetical protein